MKYKTNSNIVYNCKYHVVWCPKYRRKVLVNKVESELKKIIIEQCEKYKANLIEMEINPNYDSNSLTVAARLRYIELNAIDNLEFSILLNN